MANPHLMRVLDYSKNEQYAKIKENGALYLERAPKGKGENCSRYLHLDLAY